MVALILNSGLGSRMGEMTREHPKCMTTLLGQESILSRQLRQIAEAGIQEVVTTTGYLGEVLQEYCRGLAFPLRLHFVENPLYRETNYIYSIYLARDLLKGEGGVLLLHGDLVFADEVLHRALGHSGSCLAVSSAVPLPEKDFKAVIRDGRVRKVGVSFFTGEDPTDQVLAAQPLYRLSDADWAEWIAGIVAFCESGEEEKRRCYAENALNACSDRCRIQPLEVGRILCREVDSPEDLRLVREELAVG